MTSIYSSKIWRHRLNDNSLAYYLLKISNFWFICRKFASLSYSGSNIPFIWNFMKFLHHSKIFEQNFWMILTSFASKKSKIPTIVPQDACWWSDRYRFSRIRWEWILFSSSTLPLCEHWYTGSCTIGAYWNGPLKKGSQDGNSLEFEELSPEHVVRSRLCSGPSIFPLIKANVTEVPGKGTH